MLQWNYIIRSDWHGGIMKRIAYLILSPMLIRPGHVGMTTWQVESGAVVREDAVTTGILLGLLFRHDPV